MATHEKYPLHTGFLTKSPPETRVTGNFKRWKKRWFVLLEDKFLCYHKSRNDPNPIKTIDLRRCEYLDTNLSDKRFKNIFSIRISGNDRSGGRTYFLAAETPYEMKDWVDKICEMCDFQGKDSDDNKDKTIRHRAPLDNKTSVANDDKRDSGIIVPDGQNNNVDDLVPVVITAYDEVPPPRARNHPEDFHDQPNYDVPTRHSASRIPSCPLDVSSSDSSLSSLSKRSSAESDHLEYDVPPHSIEQPNYDYPPQPNYDYPPQPNYDYPPQQPNYDYPPQQPNYDVPSKYNSELYQVPSQDDGNDVYDVPPSSHSQPAYDYVPPPRPVYANTTPTLRGLTSLGIVQQFPNQNTAVRPVGFSQQYANYNTLSCSVRPVLQQTSHKTSEGDVYDQVPARSEDDAIPRIYNLPGGETCAGNYDTVPAPVPRQDDACVPPVSRDARPAQATKMYVNLSFPSDTTTDYKKPLPSPPQDLKRDSGNGFDWQPTYDVPPAHSGFQPPCVDRKNKPAVPVAPKVDRGCKPGSTRTRDYVNLQPIRSATVREGSNQPPRRGGNVQRSKSAAADCETEGYLYMESPKRTESSLRYSRKDKCSLGEEDEDQEYEYMERNGHDSTYQNYDTPTQPNGKKQSEKISQRGVHYQDIDVICQREGVPSIPERSPRTQYTTIDLQKTKGFRKTCEDVGKSQ